MVGRINKHKRRDKLFVFLFFIVLILISVCLSNKIFIEEIYCGHKARQIVGNNWNMPLTSTEEEKVQGFSTNITWGHREELKCWNEIEDRFSLIFYIYPQLR